MMTPKERELAEHRRWKRRPVRFQFQWFDELLANEFASLEKHQKWLNHAIQSLVRFVTDYVPYYQKVFRELRLHANDIRRPEDLVRLPVLTRQDVLDHCQSLRAVQLPRNVRLWGYQLSSGTTGNPVKVFVTKFQNLLYSVLWHRQARWFRFDPMGMLCDVRIAIDVAPTADGTKNPDGNIVRHRHWRYLGQYFHTGAECGFNLSNDPKKQVQWLERIQPDYLMTDPGLMEELALANNGRKPVESIKALLGVASQLTDSMRAQLDRFYAVPIHQTYGLNEIGKVGLRCQAGRYHVHTENCYVEIVNADGQPCLPGETGRIVVTSLRNPAMPLIRYDTGDLGTAVEGPCQCGRTLASFGDVVGRYRRYAGLPEGTRERYSAIRIAFNDLSTTQLAFLLQYQLHQFRGNHFELRLRTDGEIPAYFHEHMQAAWNTAGIEPATPLDIVRVESIARSRSGKVLDFTSDYYDDAFAKS